MKILPITNSLPVNGDKLFVFSNKEKKTLLKAMKICNKISNNTNVSTSDVFKQIMELSEDCQIIPNIRAYDIIGLEEVTNN